MLELNHFTIDWYFPKATCCPVVGWKNASWRMYGILVKEMVANILTGTEIYYLDSFLNNFILCKSDQLNNFNPDFLNEGFLG